ncbi:hypothetical protein BH23CHL2_BH23CHL2_03630 [soil metagenome]
MEILLLIVAFFALNLIVIGFIFYVKTRKQDIQPEAAIDIYFEFDRNNGEKPLVGHFSNRRLDEPVAALRALGFFSSSEDLDDRELARQIFRSINLEFARNNPLGPRSDRPTNWRSLAQAYQATRWNSRPEIDLLVAGEDAGRVWWKELDQVRPGNNGYVRTLRRWSEISRGAFMPEDIAESWGEEGEPVIVTFQLDGDEHVFMHLTSHDNHIDTAGLRNCINPLIIASGIQFEILEIRDTPNIVVALRPEERRLLVDQRGWKFAEIPTLVN